MISVYVLRTLSMTPFYIGVSHNVRRRSKQHLKKFKIKFVLHVLETLRNDNEWEKKEQYWVKFYRDTGFKLKNKNQGGYGPKGLHHSKQTRAKIGLKSLDRHTGKILSEEHREKIRKSMMGKNTGPKSDLHKLRLSVSHQGQTVSEERRRIASRAHTGRKKSVVECKRLSNVAKRRWQRWKRLGNTGLLRKGSTV